MVMVFERCCYQHIQISLLISPCMRSLTTCLISLLVMLPALAGCIGDDDVSTTKIDDGGISAGAVDISGFAFDPDGLIISVGVAVTWTNSDSATHTATADDGEFDSGDMGNGDTFAYTFNTAGTYAYHCGIHSSMTAAITVEA